MTTKRFKHFPNVSTDDKVILMDCLKGETSEI